MDKKQLSYVLMRISITSVFLYAAIASFLEPDVWESYLPYLLTSHFPAQTLLVFFSIYEIILALWVLSGIKIFYASLLSSLTLLGIIVANLNILDVVFRDFAIFFTALSLVVLNFPGKKK